MAVTKSRTGTWDLGLEDSGTRGRRDAGTWGLGDVGTWGREDVGTRGLKDVGTRGLGEVGREYVGTRRRVGIQGRDKQITPDFCAELVRYNF